MTRAVLAAFTPAQSAAGAAWATFVILVVTAIFAGWQVIQARRLRREEMRPFVIVEYEFRSVLIKIVVKNIGRTVARNVRINFDKPLESIQWKNRDFGELAILKHGIANLAPHQQVRIHFDVFPERVKAGLPLSYTATVEYADHEGRQLRPDVFVLDLGTFADTALPPKGIPDLVDEVERLRREVAKWTDGGRGLQVHTHDLDRDRRRDYREIRIERLRSRIQATVSRLWRRSLAKFGRP